MSDNEGAPARAGAWTDKAINEFLLRIVKQYKKEGKSINWKTFNMPGRTTKSLQNMWTKINKQIEEIPDDGDGSEATTSSIATPVKKGRKKAVKKEDDDGDEPVTPASGKKRGPPKTPRSNKKVKKEEDSDHLGDELEGEI